MKRQLLIVLSSFLFLPCFIHGEDHNDYVIYDGSIIVYNDKTAYVYLDDDVILDNTLTIKSNYTLYLCLHGHKLSIDGNDPVITVNKNATLILSDCTNNGSITSSKGYGIKNNGTLNFYNGSILNNGDSGVYNNSIFNMYGGTIANNKASSGAGVYNNKIFNMSGDSLICGNTAHGNSGGAGVYNDGSTFTMSGDACICNNVAKSISGGGLYAYNSTITIKDKASIINNQANVNGHDIYFHSGTLYVNDDVMINDIYLPSNNTITVLDKLSDLASIGISAQYPYKLPTLVTNINNVKSFYYNDSNYALELVDNTIKLIKAISYPTYTIDIPSSISLDEDMQVQASIDEGSSLVVKLASDNDFTLTNEDGISITYLIKQDETILNSNDIILEVNGNNSSTLLRFEPQYIPKYTGTYTGTVMFTVYIDEK